MPESGGPPLFSVLAGRLVVGLMLLLVTDVVLRATVGRPLQGTVGYVEVILATAIYFAFGHTQRTGSNIRVELVLIRMSEPVRLVSEFVNRLLVAGISVFLAYVSYPHAVRAYRVGEVRRGVIDIPLWPARVTLVVGALVLAIAAVRMAFWFRPTESAIPDEDVL
jgi:TRAP-type C4-dicarboxylate transport system permease small subunit